MRYAISAACTPPGVGQLPQQIDAARDVEMLVPNLSMFMEGLLG